MRSQTRKGFTLIELLVVIAIIGLLSTLAVVAMSNARQKARDAKRVSDIKQIQSALDLYATDRNGYPGSIGKKLGVDLKCLNATGLVATTGCTDAYMSNIPSNPTPPTGDYVYTAKTATADCDVAGTPCVNYAIVFTLEANTGELKAPTAGKKPLCTATAGGITCADAP